MKTLLVVIVLMVVAAIVLVMVKKRAVSGANGAPWPFYLKKPLTVPEQVLYHRLITAMPECTGAGSTFTRAGCEKGFSLSFVE